MRQVAIINILQYGKVRQVTKYRTAYDDLYNDLQRRGGIHTLNTVSSKKPTGALLQPSVSASLDEHVADARCAKAKLDKLVEDVGQAVTGCEVVKADLKSHGGIERKANKFCDGDIRRVTDMARISVVCEDPATLATIFDDLKDRIQVGVGSRRWTVHAAPSWIQTVDKLGCAGVYHRYPRCDKLAYPPVALDHFGTRMTLLSKEPQILRVHNGFGSDYMPSGYRDIKLNVVVEEHICEMQLHLRSFYELKPGQHKVYEWARDLNVTVGISHRDLVKDLSPEIMQDMIDVVREVWGQRSELLLILLSDSGKWREARSMLNEVRRAHQCHRCNARAWPVVFSFEEEIA